MRAEVQAARDDVTRYAALVTQDAATRQELQQAQARTAAARLDTLALQESSATSAAEQTARSPALERRGLNARLTAATAAQVVRSPVAGEDMEIWQGGATARGLNVEVVILVRPPGTSAPSAPPAQQALPGHLRPPAPAVPDSSHRGRRPV